MAKKTILKNQSEQDKWLLSRGFHRSQLKAKMRKGVIPFPNLKCENSAYAEKK